MSDAESSVIWRKNKRKQTKASMYFKAWDAGKEEKLEQFEFLGPHDFHRVGRQKSSTNGLLMMYLPWREEGDLLGRCNTYRGKGLHTQVLLHVTTTCVSSNMSQTSLIKPWTTLPNMVPQPTFGIHLFLKESTRTKNAFNERKKKVKSMHA